MYGTQTKLGVSFPMYMFENDVKMYGTQTMKSPDRRLSLFENDVKMYGTQTDADRCNVCHCLRMM